MVKANNPEWIDKIINLEEDKEEQNAPLDKTYEKAFSD
jgi:hypothetical protein